LIESLKKLLLHQHLMEMLQLLWWPLLLKIVEASPASATKYFCDCQQLELISSAGAHQHLPSYLGLYNLEGVIGENSVPFYKSSNSKYLSINIYADTDDPLTWIVSDRLGSFNAVIMNRQYTNVPCPYDVPDSWEFLYNGQWLQDQSLNVVCVS